MQFDEQQIDEFLKRIPGDVIIIGLFFLLLIFGIRWQSSTLLIFVSLIILVVVIGGYSVAKKIGKQILVKKLSDLGAQEDALSKILETSTSESSEKEYPVPPDTRQKTEITSTNKSLNYVKKAQDALQHNNVDDAISYLELAIKNDSQNWYAFSMLGSLYLNFKKDQDTALKYLLPAIELDKNHFNHFMNAGVACIWKKENKSAIEHLTKAIEIIERDHIARHIPKFVMEYGKCLMFIGEAYKNLQEIPKSKEYVKKSLEKLKEIPNQYRDELINYWIKEAQDRLTRLEAH